MGDQVGAVVGPTEEDWRTAIADDLFGEASANLPVYLFLEPERFQAIAARVGVANEARSAFARTVARSIRWARGNDLWARWRDATDAWIAGGKLGPPPALALLVLLTFAAENMVADAAHAAHNYYGRLAELLELDEERTERVKGAFNETVPFWQSLNDWLEDWQGERGWPTARAHDRRRFIGYPLSQAIVREQDRRNLHAAFEYYQLQPMRRMSAAEMGDVLDDWVADFARASANLRRLWHSDANIRRRIAEIACGELSHWTGRSDVSPAHAREGRLNRASTLDWIAELALAPAPKLDLYLVTRTDPEIAVGRYRIGALTDDAGRSAVGGSESELRFERLPGLRWASLEPWGDIGVTSLFSGVVELVGVDDPTKVYRRSPTPIVVLEADEERNQFQEVTRAQLFKQNLVLAHGSAMALVEGYLAKHARDGLRKFSEAELANLPAGWFAYADVMMVKAAEDTVNPRLEALAAGAATVISLSGGLALGHGAWHTARPPEVLAAVDNDGSFDLGLVERGAESGFRQLGAFVGRGLVDLNGKVRTGDAEIVLRRPLQTGGMAAAETVNLRLRTANTPRPIGVRDAKDLRRDLSVGESMLRTAEQWADGAPTLRGCVLYSSGNDDAKGVVSLTGPELVIFARPSSEDAPHRRTTRIDTALFVQSCAVRGYHHWICEDGHPGDNFRTLKRQQCQDCHREDWTRNRGVWRRRVGHRAQQRRPRALSDVPRYRRLTETGAEAFDLLLDAMTYLVSGSYERFSTLARALSDEEGFVAQAARTLSSLGHVEFDVDPRNGQYRDWRVAPSALVQASDGAWVLAGARSESFVIELRARALALGGEIERSVTAEGPECVALRLPEGALSGMGDAKTPLGEPLHLARDFARRLAFALPPLSSVQRFMPEFRVGSESVERFDLDEGKWSLVDHAESGAYRVDHHGLKYGYSSPADALAHVMRVGDVYLVKHLAAAERGQSMLQHQPETQTLLVPLGATLPSLLERAAVMCSGQAPRYRADAGLIAYESVPDDVAILLQNKLHA